MLFLAAAIDWNHLPLAYLRKAGNRATTSRSITLMRYLSETLIFLLFNLEIEL